MEQLNPNPSPNSGNNKKNILLWILVIFSALSVVLFYSSSQKSGQNNQTANVPIVSKGELIKAKIGDFSIEEELPYQGGTIIKAKTTKGSMNQQAVFFFKDNKLQRLPDGYITDAVKAQLPDAEKQNKTVSIKYQKEYNSGGQDKDGKDIIYNNVFLLTNELPKSQWVKNAMYPEGVAKYQVILVDEFGQMQFKFLSGQVL